jgi:hypothetical protein
MRPIGYMIGGAVIALVAVQLLNGYREPSVAYPNQTPVEAVLAQPHVEPPAPPPAPETPAARAARLRTMIGAQWTGPAGCTVENPLPALQKYAALRPEWADRYLAGVACKKAMVGMTPAMIRAEGFIPDRINRSSDGVTEHQQWVLGSGYLYFDGPAGGELTMTSWQETQ